MFPKKVTPQCFLCTIPLFVVCFNFKPAIVSKIIIIMTSSSWNPNIFKDDDCQLEPKDLISTWTQREFLGHLKKHKVTVLEPYRWLPYPRDRVPLEPAYSQTHKYRLRRMIKEHGWKTGLQKSIPRKYLLLEYRKDTSPWEPVYFWRRWRHLDK